MINAIAFWLGGETYNFQMSLAIIAFLETLTGTLVFSIPLVRRKGFPLRLAAGILVMAVVLAGGAVLRTHYTDFLWSRFLYNLMQYASLLPLLFLCYQESPFQLLKTWCAGCAAVQVGASVYAVVLVATGADDTQTMTLFSGITNLDLTVLIWFVFHLLIYFALYAVFGRKNSGGPADERAQTYMAILCIVFLAISVLINAVMSEYRADSRPLYETLRFCVVLICLSVLALHRGIVIQSQSRAEIAVMEQVLAENRKQYDTMKANIDLVNLRCHDLRHQLDKLQSRLTDEELTALREAIDLYDSNLKTGNEVLDVVLYSTQLRCMENNISFTCMADGSCLSFMRTRHIYSLFSNALDNAIEAVLRVPDPEKRVISLHVRPLSQAVEIAVMNYYEGTVTMKNGAPVTSKGNTQRHGFGTASMQYIASRYGGEVQISAKDGVYRLQLRLKMPEQ